MYQMHHLILHSRPPEQPDLLSIGIAYIRSNLTADIESSAQRVRLDDDTRAWWDVSGMLSQAENCPQTVDMTRNALMLGRALGILVQHPQRHELVRITTAQGVWL